MIDIIKDCLKHELAMNIRLIQENDELREALDMCQLELEQRRPCFERRRSGKLHGKICLHSPHLEKDGPSDSK